jgi:hypothetical protein
VGGEAVGRETNSAQAKSEAELWPNKDQAETSKGVKYEKKFLDDNHFVICLCFVNGWK